MAAGPPVLLGLRDAAMVGPCRGGGLPPAWATSKLGGSADWVPRVRAGRPRCGLCGGELALLVQVYCPLAGSPCHRAASVFACAGTGCRGAPGGWTVLRAQSLVAYLDNALFAFPSQKQESNFAAKDWCDEADDWGVCDGAESPACASLQLLGLNEAVSSSVSREADCASQFQQLRLSEAVDGSGSLNAHSPVSEGTVTATSSSAPVFKPFYISVVDEEDYSGFIDTDHADELWKEYQQREGVNLQQLMSESYAGEGDTEKYEKSEVKSRDPTFHKFMKRISVCPEQILRYSRGGQPLFITCPPANISEGIPACSNCGSKRVFEFQLMPALVSMLQSDSDLSVEFGTAIVYTCERSCWPTNHQTPLEEFVFVQEDPDQRLFK
ncbi:programmed cell death protein 2-like isoform X2 [Falco peregrinus]|uniref:programmed cell death protein 2-like isoform X2 n=1 Tax=Falco peregrinus TaxID=8954 RepID=UPI00247A2450|nr:programmed cell death protein 2-like isoform X2 [Falco peregrinus]